MTVIIINPNSTVSMTEAMVMMAQDAVPEVLFEGWTSHDGPSAIQGVEDGAQAAPPLLELVRKADKTHPDAIIIGCFDDTALSDAAKLAACPVIGIGHATYHYAALRNWRFSVVTTLSVSVPVIEGNINEHGLKGFVDKVRASNEPVLDLETDPSAELHILREAQRAEEEDDIDAVILGCAGMVNLSKSVSAALNRVTLDPVVIAARSMRWLI